MALRAITPVPITSLPAATTPLSGTEVVAVVQSGTTSKVAVSDLTAGRAISATAATLSSGNLTFSSTAQRITGDFSNATVANRLMFQTSTTNGNTTVAAIPNGTSQQGQFTAFNASNPTNASNISIIALAGEGRVQSAIAGTGTYLPMTFLTGGSERVRIDTSGNVGIGTAGPSGNLQVSAANTRVRFSNTAGTASTLLFGADSGSTFLGAETNAPIYFITNNTERMRIDSSGNVGIGTASPSQLVEASLSQNGKTQVKVTNVNAGANTSAGVLFGTSSGDNGYIGANGGAAASALGGANAVQVTNLTANPVVLATNNTERMRIDASGNVGISGTSFGSGTLVMFIANATAVPSTNPTGGGVLYVEGGALKYRGSSGTVTTIANA
jgi:hypothetical protein